MNYNISEIFLSVQGEGFHVGRTVVFVRFSGCNLHCSFCDTPHEVSPKEMSVEMISQAIYDCCFEKGISPAGIPCVFTGGEPLLQLDLPLVLQIKLLYMPLHMETNGSLSAVRAGRLSNPDDLLEVLNFFEEVTVSPKVSTMSPFVLECADTIKVLVPFTKDYPSSSLRSLGLTLSTFATKTLIFQPITPREGISSWEWRNNVTEAMTVALDRKRSFNENWRVIPQTHALMKVR
jgi:organic radical activating enzyme